MKLHKIMGIAFLAVGLTHLAWADEQQSEIKIYGGVVEKLFESNGQGPYNKLLKSIFDNSSYALNVSYSGFRRANRGFISDKNSCHFIASDSQSFYKTLDGLDISNLLFSDSINTVTLRIYSLKGSEPVASLDALKGHSILVDSPAMNSLGLYIEFPENVSWLTTKSAGQSYELLASKRGQYIIAYDLDIRIGVGEHFNDVVVWDPALNLRSLNEVMVCHATEDNRKFISYFNKRLKEIKDNGQWNKLFPMGKIE